MDFARRLHPFRGMIELQNDQIPTKTTRMQAMSLKDTLSTYWLRIQGELLPWLDDAMDGPLTAHHRQFVSVLGLARIETVIGAKPRARRCSMRSRSERGARNSAIFWRQTAERHGMIPNLPGVLPLLLEEWVEQLPTQCPVCAFKALLDCCIEAGR